MKRTSECATVHLPKEVATIVVDASLRRATAGASLEWTNAPSYGGDHATFYAMGAERT